MHKYITFLLLITVGMIGVALGLLQIQIMQQRAVSNTLFQICTNNTSSITYIMDAADRNSERTSGSIIQLYRGMNRQVDLDDKMLGMIGTLSEDVRRLDFVLSPGPTNCAPTRQQLVNLTGLTNRVMLLPYRP